MGNSIVSIIASVASLVAMTFGDKLLIKWSSAYMLWLRKKTKPAFQAQVDAEYTLMEMEWDALHDDTRN